MLRKIDLNSRISSRNGKVMLNIGNHEREVTDEDIQKIILPFLIENPKITAVRLFNITLSVAGVKLLAASANILELSLWVNNAVGDEGAEALATNTSITVLKLLKSNVGPKGAKELAANTHIKKLNLEFNHVGEEGVQSLAMNTSITTLNLGHNKLDQKAAMALAANISITNLNLRGNDIGDEGALTLGCNRNINKLDLRGNNIYSKGTTTLIYNRSITHLDLGYNVIFNDVISSWATNLSITYLNLRNNQISQKDLTGIDTILTRNKQPMQTQRKKFMETVSLLAGASFLLFAPASESKNNATIPQQSEKNENEKPKSRCNTM